MKKTKRKQKRKNSHRYYKISLLLISACLILSGLYIYRFINYELKSIIESPKTENTKIPQEVKNNISPSKKQKYFVPILMYHYVEYVTDERDTIRKSLNINPMIFESQIKTLKENGYTFITTRDLGEAIENNKPLPNKSIVITFDDGHWDNATDVLPILKKYHARATFYLIPGFINNSDFLSDKQVREIINSKIIEIGAHTVHHVSLKEKLAPLVTYEILESKRMLENKYGISVVSFAYPNGAFDNQAIETVKKSGFTTAVSTIPGTIQNNENKFFLFRLRPGYKTGEELIKYINKTSFDSPN